MSASTTPPVCPLIDSSSRIFVLCEKPSAARDLGAVLGGTNKGTHIEFPGGVVSWAFGHLLEQAPPADYRESWKFWAWEGLPIQPDGFQFRSVIRSGSDERVHAQIKALASLYREADVVVNACDAGREGELIWWELLRHVGWGAGEAPGIPGPKPAFRLWAQSNTPAGLREAWEGMYPVESRLGLAEAAYSRSEADWLLGMNLSRGATLCFPPPVDDKGRKQFWSIGRVQTPVLALIVNRDEEISKFKAKPFYEVRINFDDQEPFEASLLVPDGVAPFVAQDDGEAKDSAKSFLNQGDALDALTRVLDTKPRDWTIVDEEKPGVENPPVLFSLTDLQKWCNQVWGWEAARTLAAAQQAYEADKSLSYPRTDACFLPVDSKSKMDEVYGLVRTKFLDGHVDLPGWSVEPSLSPRASFLFDDSKLTDHYAIVPTGLIPADVTSDSGKVWLAVVRRFMSAFGPPARTATLKRRCEFGGDVAVASGKRYVDRGWLDVDDMLAPLVGQSPKSDPGGLGATSGAAPVAEAKLHEGKTTPPKPLTEASLLSLMENIHTKLDTDEEGLKEALAGKGLGTPATRAATIELLVARRYIARVKKGKAPVLQATDSGKSLISTLNGYGLNSLTFPDTTAEWESQLMDMEKCTKVGTRLSFLEGIMEEVNRCLGILRTNAPAGSIRAERVELEEVCPLSGKPIGDCGTYWDFPGFGRVPKKVAGRDMTLEEISSVLCGSSPTFDGFVSKKGSKFAAQLRADMTEKKLEFSFPEREVKSSGVLCPLSGKPVEDHGNFWKFPASGNVAFWKTMSKRDMTLEEYAALVEDGKAGPFSGFVSQAGKPFEATLVIKDGKVAFDFPDRGKPGPLSPGMKGPGAKAKSSSGGGGGGGAAAKKKKKTY